MRIWACGLGVQSKPDFYKHTTRMGLEVSDTFQALPKVRTQRSQMISRDLEEDRILLQMMVNLWVWSEWLRISVEVWQISRGRSSLCLEDENHFDGDGFVKGGRTHPHQIPPPPPTTLTELTPKKDMESPKSAGRGRGLFVSWERRLRHYWREAFPGVSADSV